MSEEERTPSQELLNRALGGDPSARDELLERERPRLKGIVKPRLTGKVGRRVGASDLVQDALVSTWRRLSSFEGSTIDVFRFWMRRIVENKFFQAIRREGRDKRNVNREESPATPSALDDLVAKGSTGSEVVSVGPDDIEWLQHALSKLKAADLELIRMRFFEKLPFDEIARRMDGNAATLRKQTARVLEKLDRGIRLLKMMEQRRFLPLQRETICLMWFQAAPQEEIAERLNIPKGAVTRWIQDVKKTIRPILEPEP